MDRLTSESKYCSYGCAIAENEDRLCRGNEESCWQYSLYSKLAEYEDLEEQGLFVRLHELAGALSSNILCSNCPIKAKCRIIHIPCSVQLEDWVKKIMAKRARKEEAKKAKGE